MNGFFQEQEDRLNHLRAKRGDHLIQFQSSDDSTKKPAEHVNLFQLEEQGVCINLIIENT
jgi:hypothetical protein